MCQSSFSLLVVIAKIATCFPQHFIPHFSYHEGLSEPCRKPCREVYDCLFVSLYFWVFSSPLQNQKVGTRSFTCARALEILVSVSLIDTGSWYLAFQNILQPSPSLRDPLKVSCVPDETHKTPHSAVVLHLPFIFWLCGAECTMKAPKNFNASR